MEKEMLLWVLQNLAFHDWLRDDIKTWFIENQSVEERSQKIARLQKEIAALETVG